jgi:hypothetical protein
MTENNKQIAIENDSENILFSSRIPKYIKENPFRTLLNIGLIIGGALAYAFFIKIGYLPELDLEDATTLLIGIALVGLGTTLIFAILLTFPSWIIYELMTSRVSLSSQKTYTPEYLKLVHVHQAKNLMFSSVLIGVLIISQWYFLLSLYENFDAYICLTNLLLIFTVTAIQKYRFGVKNSLFDAGTWQSVFGDRWSFTKYNFLLVLAWMISSMTLILIFAKPINQFIVNKNWLGLLLNLFLFILIIYNNSLIATVYLFKKNITKSLTITIGITFSSLVAYLGLPSNQINFISVPFQTFQLGNIENSAFIVNKDTCEVLNRLNAGSCNSIENEGFGCVYPKNVASRIGKEYLLVFESGDKDSSNLITIPLKKEAVLGWSYNNLHISADCKINTSNHIKGG